MWHVSSFFLIWLYLCFTSIYCFLVSFTICTKEATFKCCCTNCVMTIKFDSRQRCRQGCNALEQRENGDGEGRLAVCHFVPAGMELAFILGKEANARTAPLRPKQQQATAINSSEFQEALRLTDRADASHIMTLTRREFRVNSERLQFGPTLPSKGRVRLGELLRCRPQIQQVPESPGVHLSYQVISAVIG